MAEETTRNPQARRFVLHSTMTYDLLNPLLNLDSLDDSSPMGMVRLSRWRQIWAQRGVTVAGAGLGRALRALTSTMATAPVKAATPAAATQVTGDR